MQVETKYDINSRIYFIYGQDIKEGHIQSIKTSVGSNNNVDTAYSIRYESSTINVNENKVYSNKLDAAYFWLGKQGLDPREVLQGYLSQTQGTLDDI